MYSSSIIALRVINGYNILYSNTNLWHFLYEKIGVQSIMDSEENKLILKSR